MKGPRMKMPQMIAAEFRRLFSGKMSVLALIALICVPILYGGLYLWANQDPYGNLSNVPVALVVSDTGAEINDEQRNIGDEVADELLEGDDFQWHRTTAAEATEGLDAGTYDFAIEIPADFSDSIASISSKDPHVADLLLRTNDANNYLATTIGNTAIEKIRTTVSEKVIAEAGSTLLDGISTMRGKLVDAADGADQITDGLETAQDGVGRMGDGTKALTDGTGQLVSGSTDLADGTQQVADGAGQLTDGLDTIATNLDTLTDGTEQVADGTQQVADVADRIGDATQEAYDALPQFRSDLVAELKNQGLSQHQINQIVKHLDPLNEKLGGAVGEVEDVRGKIDALASGASQVNDGAKQLRDGAHTAASSAGELRDGAEQTAAGATQIKDGASALDEGAQQLDTAVGDLADGLDKLHDGSTELGTGLNDGVDSLPNDDEATRASQADVLGAPVDISSSNRTAAENYGAGLAPFFAALAAWIGIYALFLIVKPISRRAITALHAPVRVTLAGWATPALLGVVQMIGLFSVLAFALKFDFANPAAALGMLIFAEATYTAIILALTVWLSSVGKFLGLVLMVLQLVTAGGTFPWQTLPEPLMALHHVLPMGYVVDAMRQIMYGSMGMDRVWNDIGVLLIWLLGALLLSAVGVARMTRKRTLRDLEPSLIG